MISRRVFGASLVAAGVRKMLARPADSGQQSRPPNFVIFLADDLGYGDLGCYGNRSFATPRLDGMAREGARLTEFCAAPTCTPARASLLTGRYPIRSGLVRVLIPREHFGLPDTETTLAQALKPAGYRSACIGKWHLGDLPRYRPNQHGFDYFYGLLYSNDMTLVMNIPRLRLYRNEKVVETPVTQPMLTRRYTEEAKKFIAENRDRPFLLYVPYSMPHIPVSASPRFRGSSGYSIYGDAVQEIDWSVGQVLDCLKQHGLDENTLAVFTSDNGPALHTRYPGGSTGGLRGGKATTWEGGVRVPCIVRWPAVIPGGATKPGIASLMDLFTTCVAASGAQVPDDRPIDGVNLMPFLRGESPSPVTDFYYYFGRRLCAVRADEWKLHLMKRDYGPGRGPRPFEKCRPPELYNVRGDPGETRNVAGQYPGVVEALLAATAQFQDAVQAGKLPKSHLRSLLPRLHHRPEGARSARENPK